MIRIAIVEDEKEYQDTLLSYIKRYREEHFADIATSVFSDGMDLVDDYHGGFDILLMDIKMKHLDGMKAARKIRSMDQAVVIIFITTMAQYAVAGYEVDALADLSQNLPRRSAWWKSRAKRNMSCYKRTDAGKRCPRMIFCISKSAITMSIM